ncbi:DEAD/DEAH box helicase [Actinophytocola sp.]|uniref:DEAD/DEAH box helicase n=1 Tax=Actinophytocola sp. TaxID=1872138 RepID=UPI0025C0AEF4|nr:DEAD/DEAH box helicase [Actinophytocola sp.]
MLAREQSTVGQPVLPEALLGLLGRLAAAPAADPVTSALVDQAVAVLRRPGFDTLLSLPQLTFQPFDYQRETAATVLRRMRGRAILADEVGLGKTIEAGLIASELRLRGLADRTLVITPAGLVEQWRDELERKFGLPTVILSGKDPVPERRGNQPVLLASLAAGRRDPLKTRLTGVGWDLVIADEAHRLRSTRSASGKLIRALTTRFLLLLTATPVENKLQDLYEMISLVAPGLLGTPSRFRTRHAPSGGDVRSPRNLTELRARTQQVMVRHRRSEVALRLPQRLAETVLVTPDADERDMYAELADRIRVEAKEAPAGRRLALRSVARLAGSTPAAAAPTLTKLGWSDLAAAAAAITAPAKVRLLVAKLGEHVARGEKVLVFTAFRQTLDAVAASTRMAGIDAAVYHGSLPRADKERAIGAFRDDRPVLLSTESAGEGRNLQFCHVMINLDLPWNPMQIEQRLGRLHRVGQTEDVRLTNLACRGSIEERILHVLETKINMFELVVGELDMILGRIDEDFDFERAVFDAFTTSEDGDGFARSMDEIGEDLAAARTGYLADRSTVDALVGEDDA